MATDDNKIAPIDLDMSLDDIEDLPSFAVFPTGAYVVDFHLGFEEKVINEHKALTLEMKLKEIAELNPSSLDVEGEKPPIPGDIATLAWMLDNKFGVGTLKDAMLPFKEKFGTGSVRQVMEASKGITALVIVKRTYDKAKDRHYMKLVKLGIM